MGGQDRILRQILIRILVSATVNVPKHKNAYLKQGGGRRPEEAMTHLSALVWYVACVLSKCVALVKRV